MLTVSRDAIYPFSYLHTIHATTAQPTLSPQRWYYRQRKTSSLHPSHETLDEGREGEYAGADGDAYFGIVRAEADGEAEGWREEEEGG